MLDNTKPNMYINLISITSFSILFWKDFFIDKFVLKIKLN